MKKLFLSLVIIASTLFVYSQNDPNANKILAEVSKKYNAYKTIHSEFKFDVKDSKNKLVLSDSGEMFFNKPKKQYAIKLNDQEIISNGKSVWNIVKDIKEIQITDAENSTNTIGPNNLFTFYQSGYKYQMTPDETFTNKGNNEVLKAIELFPENKQTNYTKIKLRINKNNHIHDVTIYDQSNNIYTYTIESMYLGKSLGGSYFTFDKTKYKGYEIVDLR